MQEHVRLTVGLMTSKGLHPLAHACHLLNAKRKWAFVQLAGLLTDWHNGATRTFPNSSRAILYIKGFSDLQLSPTCEWVTQSVTGNRAQIEFFHANQYARDGRARIILDLLLTAAICMINIANELYWIEAEVVTAWLSYGLLRAGYIRQFICLQRTPSLVFFNHVIFWDNGVLK